MNRRNFLSLFSAGIAGIALEQAIPLGRVWSFPKKIVIAKPLFFDGVHFQWGEYEKLVKAEQATIVIRETFSPHPSGFHIKKLEWRRADGVWERLGPSVLTPADRPAIHLSPS